MVPQDIKAVLLSSYYQTGSVIPKALASHILNEKTCNKMECGDTFEQHEG